MAIAAQLIEPQTLTYEEYLATPETMQRYDIVDGVLNPMRNPTSLHQEVVLNLGELLRQYQRKAKNGRTLISPRDILITETPLRTRQPDILYISNEQLAKCKPITDPSPLEAPEVAIEILSPRDTRGVHGAKIADYCAIGVKECWVVSPEAEDIHVLRLTAAGAETVAIYGPGQTLTSLTFPDLIVSVDDVFAL